MNCTRVLLERLCRCSMSSTCLTGRERLRGDLANRDLSIFIWDLGQYRPCLLIKCHYKEDIRKCQFLGGMFYVCVNERKKSSVCVCVCVES